MPIGVFLRVVLIGSNTIIGAAHDTLFNMCHGPRCKAHAARVDAVRVGGQVHRTGAILDPGGADMNETKQVH